MPRDRDQLMPEQVRVMKEEFAKGEVIRPGPILRSLLDTHEQNGLRQLAVVAMTADGEILIHSTGPMATACILFGHAIGNLLQDDVARPLPKDAFKRVTEMGDLSENIP